MRRSLSILVVVVVGAIAPLLTGGCAAPGKSASSSSAPPPLSEQAALSNTDPCALRLHDFCGPLLIYFGQNHDIPTDTDELKQIPGFADAGPFECPLSHKPYVYNPQGVATSNPALRMILYDPEPSHRGMRWAVAIQAPKEGQPLVAKVIAVPEAQFPKH